MDQAIARLQNQLGNNGPWSNVSTVDLQLVLTGLAILRGSTAEAVNAFEAQRIAALKSMIVEPVG